MFPDTERASHDTPEPIADWFESTEKQELDPAARASAAALAFLERAAAGPPELSSLPNGVGVGRPDSMTPALALAWLPTLPKATKDRWLGHLADFAETPSALFAGGPAHLEAEAALAVATWRAVGDRDALRASALRLIGSSLEHGGRHELDPAQSAYVLHPVLLAARLAGLVPDQSYRIPTRRWRRIRPLDIVKRHLESLAQYLLEADLRRATPTCPCPEWILCLSSELWRQTTPWSADIRTPLEVAIWERWRRLRYAQDLDATTLASLLIAAENMHIDVDLVSLRWRLASLQRVDGSFPASPLLTVHPGPRHLGSTAITTVLATRALTGQPRTSGLWIR